MMELDKILNQSGRGEHTGGDGLIYCDACGRPRQLRLDFGDCVRTVRCLCPCQAARERERREQLRRQEEYDRLARLRQLGLKGQALGRCTFAASRFNSRVLEYAKNYVNQWPEMRKQGLGLLLWGKVGTGKTYIAACMANELIARGTPVLMTSFGRILGSLPGPASGEQTGYLDELVEYPLLILDDLGAERGSVYALEMIYHIIDARYRSGRPMVITTNLSPQELENPQEVQRARIYSRILECCMPVRVDEAPIREAIRKQKYETLRRSVQDS